MTIKIVQSSTPQGFAKGIAKAQLNSLNAYIQKHPNEPRDEQYHAALAMRPGYTEENIKNIIKGAKDACKQNGIDFNFQAVVTSLAAYEYLTRTKQSPYPVMNELNKGVISVIPGNI